MAIFYTFSVILIFWALVYALNTFLIECSLTSARYAKILSKKGLSINLFQIKWYTVKCNRLFVKLSNWKPKFLMWWFNAGVIFGLIGQVGSIFLLTYTLIDFFRSKPTNEQILVPVVPGVNLPSDQTAYYIIALFLCGIVHEFGHAIAASRENVRVNGFGIFMMFIFPGAYVDLCTDHLLVVSPLRQLRIFCAGVWHNFVLVLLAIGCLQLHPFMISALFSKNAHVTNVVENSPLKSLIKENSVILQVGNCKVENSLTFYECLYKIEVRPNSGYCMQLDEIFQLDVSFTEQKDENLSECCPENATISNYCFKWNSKENKNKQKHHACLPARYVTDKRPCIQNSDCLTILSNYESSCVIPIWDNTTKLIRIILDQEKKPILYVGSIKELIYSIVIEDYVPKFKFIPKFFNKQLQLILKYIISFSGAIGILNLVPCFALDGQYILASLLSVNQKPTSFVDQNEPKKRSFLYIALMILGTILLLLNMCLALFSLVISKTSNFFT